MLTLRLFHASNPRRQIESRLMDEGALTIGRDGVADWRVDDAAAEISRRHCVLTLDHGKLRLRDISANGVYLGAERRRAPRETEVALDVAEPFHLGQYTIVIEHTLTPANDRDEAEIQSASLDAPFHAPILKEPTFSASAFSVKSDWDAPHPAPVKSRDVAADSRLLEAFCEGAGLDPLLLVGEAPADVMRRAGAIYRQSVLGLSDLMSERTSVKAAYRMDCTAVSATGNNPFKWVDAHLVAIDLLRSANQPFVAGAAAVNESFKDMKKHLLCLMAGSRGAVEATLAELNPNQIEDVAKGSIFQGKGEARWRAFEKRYAEVAQDAQDNAESAINRAFKAAYEREVKKLDGLEA
jgi:predicted component of type VI protein secretion system